MKIISIFSVLFLLMPFYISAQVENEKILQSDCDIKNKIPVVAMPDFDVQALLDEDKKEMKNKPYRFAKVFPVNLSTKNAGVWNILETGEKIWRLRIKSKNALSIGLVFKNFKLPKNAELKIYNSDKSHFFGSITHKNNNARNILPTAQIRGDEIIVEYYQKKNAEFDADFFISNISHDYRGFYKSKSQDCELNINCPEGNNFQDVKHAICKYTFDGYICSGALVGNTNNDNIPYFLTANSCVNTQAQADNTVFYFNYEADNCEGTSGFENQTISGATLKATADNRLDFTLLELSSVPPESYEPYYAGWDYRENIPDNTTCIHHPDGDIKKISKDNEIPGTGSFYGYDYGKHWRIFEWDLGTTETASTGAPLFDNNKRIIGDLSGGQSNCNYNYNDYFQKFSNSWDDYPENYEQLKHWLDPENIDPGFFDGYNPYGTFPEYNSPQNLQANTDEFGINLIWESPSSSYNSEWHHYATINDLTNLNWVTPERAVFFDDFDFNFTYPAQITKISSAFFEHNNFPWADSTFRFKIYDTSGDVLLYESGDIEAEHLTEIEHELSYPVYVDDDFYVAVVPVHESGFPSSASVQVVSGSTNSYNGSVGNWEIYDDGTNAYEYITGVFIGGSSQKIERLNKSKKQEKQFSEIDYSKIAKIDKNEISFKNTKDLAGYIVYRDNENISGTLPVSSVFFVDNMPAGEYTYCVKAVYSGGASVCSNEQIITINPPIVVNAIDDISLPEGFGTYNIDISSVFDDPDGDPMTYSAVSNSPDIVTVEISGTDLIISETGTEMGTANIIVTANDGNAGTSDDIFVLNLGPVPAVIIIASPNCETGSIIVTSDLIGSQTFYLCDENGTVLENTVAEGNSYEFNNLETNVYTGKVEKDGLMSELSSPIALINDDFIEANAGNDDNICNNTYIMQANDPTHGTGIWNIISGTAIISEPNNPNTTISELITNSSVNLSWTITNGTCEDTDNVIITTLELTQITSQPEDIVALYGDDILFNVIAGATNINYQWRFDGNNIVSANESTYFLNDINFENAGNYDVVVSGDCGDEISDVAVLTVNPNSVNEISEYEINIYPNPSSGIFDISFTNEFANSEIIIFDIVGKVIYENFLKNSGLHKIDLSVNKKGIYYIKIKNNDFSIIRKLIIK